MIYCDNSATSFYKPSQVLEEVTAFIQHPGNANRGINLDYSRKILYTRQFLANFFDFDDLNRVIFTSGITESLNIVLHGLFQEGDEVITTFYEHNSVLRPLNHIGVNHKVFDGTLESLKQIITNHTKGVIVNHVSNVTGHINDIESIGNYLKEKGILFIVDSAQSAGILPISMNNIDILCFTGHKGLLGLPGIGGFIFKSHIHIPPLKQGGTGTHSFNLRQPEYLPDLLESGTLNIPGILSLYASIPYLNQRGITSIYQHEYDLAEAFYQGICDLDEVIIYGYEKNHIGIVSINIKDMDAGIVADLLFEKYGIETRAGAHCAPLVHKHYHTSSMIRFSFGLNNTMKDVNICIQAIHDIIGGK